MQNLNMPLNSRGFRRAPSRDIYYPFRVPLVSTDTRPRTSLTSTFGTLFRQLQKTVRQYPFPFFVRFTCLPPRFRSREARPSPFFSQCSPWSRLVTHSVSLNASSLSSVSQVLRFDAQPLIFEIRKILVVPRFAYFLRFPLSTLADFPR